MLQADSRAVQLEARIAKLSSEVTRQAAAAAASSHPLADVKANISFDMLHADVMDHGQDDPCSSQDQLIRSQPCSECEHHKQQALEAYKLTETLQAEADNIRLANKQLTAEQAELENMQSASGVEYPLNPRTVAQLLRTASRCKQLEQRCADLHGELESEREKSQLEAQHFKAGEQKAMTQQLGLEADMKLLTSDHEQLKVMKAAADQAKADLQHQMDVLQAQLRQQAAAQEDSLQDLQDRLQAASTECQQAAEQKHQLQSELSVRQAKALESDIEVQRLHGNQVALQRDLAEAARKAHDAEAKSRQLCKDAQQQQLRTQDDTAALADALHCTEARLTDVTSCLDEQQEAFQACQAELAKAQGALAGADEQVATRLAAADAECRQLKHRLEERQAALRESQTTLLESQAASRSDAAEQECRELACRVSDSQTDMQLAQQALHTIQQDAARQTEDAECRCRRLTQELDDTTKLLKDAQDALSAHAVMSGAASAQQQGILACIQAGSHEPLREAGSAGSQLHGAAAETHSATQEATRDLDLDSAAVEACPEAVQESPAGVRLHSIAAEARSVIVQEAVALRLGAQNDSLVAAEAHSKGQFPTTEHQLAYVGDIGGANMRHIMAAAGISLDRFTALEQIYQQQQQEMAELQASPHSCCARGHCAPGSGMTFAHCVGPD